MSRWWFSLGLLFPLILIGLCVALQANWYSLWLFFSLMLLVSWFVCCWRLCEAFHRSKLLVFPMILPFLGWPVFMYLSWISRADDDAPAIRDQDRFLFS